MRVPDLRLPPVTLLLAALLVKRSNKLETAVLKQSELALDAYLSATKANAVLVAK